MKSSQRPSPLRAFPEFAAIPAADSILFDLFRGLSALVVCADHLYRIFLAPSLPADKSAWSTYILSHLSTYAVMIFFVLSGHMIATSCYRNVSQRHFESFDLKKFLTDRLRRLYPPLLFSLLLLIAAYGLAWTMQLDAIDGFRFANESSLMRDRLELDPKNILGSLLFLNGLIPPFETPSMNGPLWSLAYEAWYYFIFATLLCSLYNKRWLALTLLCAVGLSTQAMSMHFWAGFVVWLAGAALAVLRQSRWIQNVHVACAARIATPLLLIAFLACIHLRDIKACHLAQKYVFGLLFCAFLLWIFSRPRQLIQRLSVFRLYRTLANTSRFSYTLYVIHFPIALLVFALLHKVTYQHIELLWLIAILLFGALIALSERLSRLLEDKQLLSYYPCYIQGVKPPAP